MSDQSTIYIVDDDAAVRDALTILLKAAGHSVKSFKSAADFLGACTPGIRGCAILDLELPDMDGTSLQEELVRRGLQLPVIFLTAHGTIPVTVRAMKAGAIDFLTKPIEGSILLAHVQTALKQGALKQRIIGSTPSTALMLATLTPREREVLKLSIAGHATKEIGIRLGISHRTVELHRAHILQKTGASNLLEIASVAGLLEFL